MILAATGLNREAALLAGPDIVIIAGGGDPIGLRAKLEAGFAQVRPQLVLSIGLAGALSPELKVGDWVVASAIDCEGGEWTPDDYASSGMTNLLGGSIPGKVFYGSIAAGDDMVSTASAKAALHAKRGALAVDMESHIVADVAANHGVPFAVLRVISDGADSALPKAAQAGMKKDGGMDTLAVLRELLRDLRQLPALIRTGREAEVAFRRLALLNRNDFFGRLGIGDPDLGKLPLHVI